MAGVRIPWKHFYQGQRRQRVTLPAYPFERKRYWLEPGWGKPGSAGGGGRRKIEDWFYLPSWKRSLLPVAAATEIPETSATAETPVCILLTDRSGVGIDLGQRLELQGWRVVWILAGEEFQRTRETHFEMRVGVEEDWRQLSLELEDVVPRKIVHCWNCTPPAGEPCLDEGLDRGFYSLLYLGQSLGARNSDLAVDILIVSAGAHAVEGNDRTDPVKATLLGPARILPQEFTGVRCVSIDVPWSEDGTPERRQVVEQLLREFHGPVLDNVVAYRGRHRWLPAWERIALERQFDAPRLRDEGVYLITGGLGGMGLEIADDIAAKVHNPRLLLLGRSPFPERDQWEAWVQEHTADDPACVKIRRLRAMEERGARVHVIQADVSDRQQVAAVRQRTEDLFGKVHGIIHAAGIAGGGLLQFRGHQQAARVLEAKVKGTLFLHQMFPDLDFMVLCSSITAVLGGVGQVDYCAANAFMDSFATFHNNEQGTKVISINWDAWQEVGMAAGARVPREWEAHRSQALKDAIRPREGVLAFAHVLSASVAQVVVSTHDLQTRIVQAREAHLQEAASGKGPRLKYPRPESAGPFELPASDLETALAAMWSELLGIELVGRHDNFFDLGGHSLLAIQLISRVREVFGAEAQMGSLFENNTPAAFAGALQIMETQPGELEEVARMMNAIGAMSETELMQSLEQSRIGATQA